MRREAGRTWHRALAAIAAVALLTSAPARSQTLLRGVAEVQYETLDRVQSMFDRDSWLKSFQVDYSTRIRRTYELSSQVVFSELTFTGRPERTSTPYGTLRLAHPFFGFSGSYRPVTVTDERNQTSKQQELMLTGYLQRAKLPRLVGSWIRRNLDPSSGFPGSVSVTRNVTATYGVGPVGLHAGWGDQSREATTDNGKESVNDHFQLGGTSDLKWRRGSGTFQYDYLQTRSTDGGSLNDVSRVHIAGVNASQRLSTRTTGSLVYTFRHTGDSRPGSGNLTENDGSLTLTHQLSRPLQISGAGGIRSATVGAGKETESYVAASITADAEPRPGWRLGGSAGHSVNWLPGDRGRPIDSFHSNTSMRLAKDLEVTGDAGVTLTSRLVLPADPTASSNLATLTTGAGLRATPLRPLTLIASTRHYRTSNSLWHAGPSINSSSLDVSLRPSAVLQATGGWSLSSNPGSSEPDRTTLRATAQWNPTSSIEASGTYTRASQAQTVRDVGTSLPGSREAYGARLLVGVTRDLRTTIQYSETDPGLPTHGRQVNVTVTQSFGR